MKCQHEWARSSTCLGGTAFARWLTCTKCGTTTPKIEGNDYPEPPAVELDVTDNPNWDLEIPLVMGAVDRGALAHRIRAWGAQQFAAGKAAALAELHPHYEAEKQRADRLQAQANEAAFDKLLSNEPQRALAQHDADTYGMGLMVDGKRVDPGRVQMFLPKPRPEFVLKATVGTARINPNGDEATVLGRQEIDVPCSHAWDCDQLGFKYSIWRCSKCGTERVR